MLYGWRCGARLAASTSRYARTGRQPPATWTAKGRRLSADATGAPTATRLGGAEPGAASLVGVIARNPRWEPRHLPDWDQAN